MKNLAEQLSESCSEPIRMTDPEQVLDYLEQQIPGLSAAAVDVAIGRRWLRVRRCW